MILTHSASLSWALLSEVVIVLAVLLSLSRLVLPFANEFSDVIAEQMEEIIHYPVSLGNIEASWAGIKPLIKLNNVVIGDLDKGEPIAKFDRIRLKIDPWKSLVQGRFVPEILILRGSQIEIVRTKEGQLLFRGFEFAREENAKLQTASLQKLAGLTLNLRDIHVLWNDQLLNQKFAFDAEQLDLQITNNSLLIDSHINLPQSLGEQVHLIAKTKGPIEDMRAWQTEVYLKGESIDVQGIPFTLPKPLPTVSAGELNLELWGDWTESAGLVMTGEFDAHHLRFDGDEGSGAAGRYEFVDQIGANLSLRGKLNDWQLDLDQMDIVTARRHWPSNGLSLAYQKVIDEWTVDATSQSTWSGHIDLLDSGELLRLAALSPAYQGRWAKLLLDTNPQGELVDFDFKTTTTNGALSGYRLAAAVEDFSWQAAQLVPGASAVSGSISFDQQGGDAIISNAVVDFDSRKIFGHDISLDSLQTDIAWQQSEENFKVSLDRLKLMNEDFSSTGTLQLVLDKRGLAKKKAPRLDLEMIVPQLQASVVKKYIPYAKLRSKKARNWLRHALISGVAKNGIVSYHGALSRADFRSNKASMVAKFDVEAAQLHYRNDWPDARNLRGKVRFDNARLQADINHGKLLDATLGPVEVIIEDLFLGRLNINGAAHGDVSDLLGFLRQSPLVGNMDAFLDSVESHGNAQLQLALKLPLSKKIVPRETPDFHGYVTMENNHFTLPRNNLEFEQVNGVVAFDTNNGKSNYRASGLTAKFRGGQITTNIGTDKARNLLIESQGDFSAPALLPALKTPLGIVASGSSMWKSELTIPSTENRNNGKALSLKVSSDLYGMALQLPDEFAKQANIRRKLSLVYELTDQPNLKLWLGNRIFLDADFDRVASEASRSSKALKLQRGILQLGGGTLAKKPRQGIALTGKWPELRLQPWLALSAKLRQPESNSGFDLRKIDLDVRRFFLSDSLAVSNAKMNGEKHLHRWHFEIDSKELAGKLDLPDEWNAHRQMNAELRFLHWPKKAPTRNQTVTQTSAISPARFPAMNIEIESVSLGERTWGALNLKTIPTKSGMKIEHLKINNDHYRAILNGRWNEFEGQSQSDLAIQLTAVNTGNALDSLRVDSDLSDGLGNLSGNISWPGAFFSPDFATASGHLDLSIKSGKLNNVEPGLGRLISLVSLNNLPRRLTLNFKDLSEEGLYFDTLSGGLSLRNGDLVMEDMRIDSPLVDVDIAGSTNLLTQRHDLQLEVTPKIKSSLPIAAGLLAGPQTGALVFLVDKLAESMGVDFNKTVVRNFSVTGSWDNPVIDSLQNYAQDVSENAEELF